MNEQPTQVLGVKITGTNEKEVLESVMSKLKSGKRFYITTPNPEIVVTAQTDPELMAALNDSDITIADGVGLVWALKIMRRNVEVVKGRELFVKLLEKADEHKLKVYLLGASEQVNKKAIEKILSKYSDILVQGNSGGIVIENDLLISKDIERDINMFEPDLVFVAFGAPKQEKWVHKNISHLKVKGMMVVGGSLDYFVGEYKPVPNFVSGLGLEWVWRLINDPSRLKRIINAVVVFPLLFIFKKRG